MKVIDLLNKIANGEIENNTIFYVKGDFFYDLIVIDEKLYVINSMTKQLELLESKYIGRFIRDDVELAILKEVEIIEEDKKIEKLSWYSSDELQESMIKKINEIIDYLEENK